MKKNTGGIGFAIVGTLFLGLVYFLLDQSLDGASWEGMKLSHTVADKEYCEFNDMDDLFRQQINTWSNLVFFFLGSLVLFQGWGDKKFQRRENHLAGFPALSFFTGFSLIYLCFGSTFFHASLTWVGQCVDMNATFSVSIAILLIAVYRLCANEGKNTSLKRILMFSFFALVFLFIYLHLRVSSFILLPGLILMITILSVINYTKNRAGFKAGFALLSVLCILLADLLRELDIAKWGCDPASILQGHSAWHFLMGFGAYFSYRFYRDEKLNNSAQS